MRMRHIVIRGLSGYAIFFHVLINGKISLKKGFELKMYVLIFCTTFA
jgi:hypothetical protein